MNLRRLEKKEEKIAVVGLGYVGLPLAVAFSEKYNVIGFDLNQKKIELYIEGIDSTKEVGDSELSKVDITYTYEEDKLGEASTFIVAVPTPINKDKTPNLNPIKNASKIVGRSLSKGSVVVFESTVYPGTTEEICLPILEEFSGLKCGKDFFIGYSPERINPGDKNHRLENIVKVVSGSDLQTLNFISNLYSSIIKAGVYEAKSIKVAEAAKIIENSQRDINIGFMNELSLIFDKLDIDTREVLEAASTKWNFLNFSPGLVGGHCIGVDPYYLTYKAEEVGYNSQIILSGRKINDSMGKYISEVAIKKMAQTGKKIKNSRVGILGFTFKNDCPDTRNTKVIDIINDLNEYGIKPIIYDPVASFEEVKNEYGLCLSEKSDLINLDVLILAVDHKEFKEQETIKYLEYLNVTETSIIIDVKSILDKYALDNNSLVDYWRL